MSLYRDILKSFDGDEWSFNEFRAIHSSGVQLWIGNSIPFVKVCEPSEYKFNIIQKCGIWFAMKRCMDRQLCEKLKGIQLSEKLKGTK